MTEDETTIVDAGGDPDVIAGRVHQIRTEIDNTESDWDREKLQERLDRLVGGVAVFKIGAATETELAERLTGFQRRGWMARPASVRYGMTATTLKAER